MIRISSSLFTGSLAAYFLLFSYQATSGDLESANIAANEVHSNGKTALMLAARDRDRAKVDRLLAQGADVNAANDNGGTPIMYAALGGDLEIVREFLDRGAEIDAVAKNGWSALMIASAKGFEDVTQELLDDNANPNLLDVYLWSPLMRAVYEDRELVVQRLLQSPLTDVNHRGENGITALHIATSKDYYNLVQILLGHGADKSITDSAGRTPYRIAEEKKASKLLILLKDD